MNLVAKLKGHPLYLFPDFRKFFIGDMLVAVAERYFAITFAWWLISQEGENGKWLGILMAMEALPILFLSPFVGPLIDRYNKKKCMLIGVLMQALFVSIIALLLTLNQLEFLYLCILSFCMSCFIPQFEDSVSASVAKLVDQEHLSSATTIQSSTVEFSNIISAVLSTSVIAFAGITHAVYVNIALYIIGALFLLAIKISLAPTTDDEDDDEECETGYIAELKEGLIYIKNNNPLLAYAAVYACETFFIVPIFIMIPMLVKNVLHESVNWVAIFETSLSIGAVLMTLCMSFKNQYRNFYSTYAGAMLLIGICMGVIGFIDNGHIMTIIVFCMGALFAALMALSFTMFQHAVPEELKGRFFGVMSTIAAGMSPLSYMVVGTMSDILSIQNVMIFAGIGAAVVGLIALKIPRITEHVGCEEMAPIRPTPPSA